MAMRNSVVAVVVDRQFGDRLSKLASRLPVWIGTSLKNRTAVDHVRAQHPGYDITSINAGADYSGEDLLLSQLEVIDLHHHYWRTIEVYGTPLTPMLTMAFEEFGVTEFKDTSDGFLATRPEPPAAQKPH
jgi:hypothetical protein